MEKIESNQILLKSDQQNSDQQNSVMLRWIVIFGLSLTTFVNGSIYSYFLSLSTIFQKTYDIPLYVIQMGYAVDPLFNVASTFIIGQYLLKNLSKYACLFAGVIGFIICMWMRTLINISFAFVFISNIFKGMSTPLIGNIVAKTSNDWFPPSQRMLATVFGIVCGNIGNALCFIISPRIIGDFSDPIETKRKIQESAVGFSFAATFILFISLSLYRNNPDPRKNLEVADSTKENVIKNILVLAKNKNFIKLFLFTVIPMVLNNTASALLSSIMKPFGFNPQQAGIFMGVVFIFGLSSSFVLAGIVGKTKKFKLISILLQISQILVYIVFISFCSMRNFFIMLFCGAFFGMSSFPIISLGLEFGSEIAFPIGQASVSSCIFASSNLFTFFAVVLNGILLENPSLFSVYIYIIITIGFLVMTSIISCLTDETLNRLEHEKTLKVQFDAESKEKK